MAIYGDIWRYTGDMWPLHEQRHPRRLGRGDVGEIYGDIRRYTGDIGEICASGTRVAWVGEIYGDIWRYTEIYGRYRGDIWRYMEIYGDIREICGHCTSSGIRVAWV